MRPALISNYCLNNTYQSIKGLQLTELLWELLGVIQVDCPTLNMLVLCACRQLPRLGLIKDLLKINDVPFVLALNESNPEHIGRLVDDPQAL